MSTYTPSLGLEAITPGDQAGLWGNTTNNNLALIDQAVTGVTPISFTGLSGTTYTLTSFDGAVDEARASVLNISGIATGSNTVVVPNKQKTYLVRNATGQDVVFRTASPTATYTVGAGNSILIFCDGNNNVFTGIASPSVGTLGVAGGGTGQTTFGGGGFVKSSGGTNALTASSAVNLASEVTGTLPVPNGGTGLSTLTAGAILRGAGSSAPALVSGPAGVPGQVLTWNGSQWEGQNPASAGVSSISAGSGISVNQSTGAVTVTNSGVTSLTAGTGISVSGSSGGVTVTNTGPTLSSNNTWTGTNTFNGGANILGVTNGSNASAGYVGQIVSSLVNSIAVPNSVDTVLTSIVLTPGDWDIQGLVSCNNSGFLIAFNAAVNTTPTIVASTGFFLNGGGTFGPISMPIPYTPTNVTTTITVYLLARFAYASGPTALASGNIFARRIR